MGEKSGIQWTDATFNPWWGCVEVSPACDNCYARTLAHRYGYGWGADAERRFFGEKHWQEPIRWNARAASSGEPFRVFCASMADVFERLPHEHPQAARMDAERARLFQLIEATPALTWMLLTKRPQNITRMVPRGWLSDFPSNVWAGVTAEDQEWFERRWRRLKDVPAPVRFISYEPGLGPLDLRGAAPEWVIIGTESGPKRRPMPILWVREIVAQCASRGIAAFVKQLQPNGLVMHDLIDFPPDLRVREFPTVLRREEQQRA